MTSEIVDAHAARGEKCAGCDKPFTLARKPRLSGRVAFVGFRPNAQGHAASYGELLHLCGQCRNVAAVRPFDLPALERAVEQVERLHVAAPTGALQ